MIRKKDREKFKRRREEAKNIANRCADLLRNEYDVDSVYLIGSSVSSKNFHPKSDIDLLVEGLSDKNYFRALKKCWDLLPPDFELDLIPWEEAPSRLKKKVEEKGELI